MKIQLISFFVMISLLASALDWPLSEIKIEVAKPSDPIQKLAGEEMEKHLQLIAGKRNPGNEFTFLIGTMAPGQNKKLEKTETHYAIRGNKAYFWGDDHFQTQLIDHLTRCGTLSAVYAFLENELGVHWIRPTDAGIVYESRQTLALPESKDYQWIMPMEMTGVRVYWWRNRLVQPMNAFTPGKLRMTEAEVNERQWQDHLWFRRMRHGKRTVFRYGHAFTAWWEKYGKEHPEYFGLDIHGKRGLSERLRGREKLCLSNPAVVDLIIKEWTDSGKPQYWNICPNDGTPGFCHCENCMALDARKPGEEFLDHLTDRYLWFWNRVAEKAVKLRSDVKLITYVYSYYRHPPRREKVEYPDNMLLGMVPGMFEDNAAFFDEWAKVGAKNIFLRPNDLCGSMPFNRGLEKRIYDKFQASARFKIFGTDYDGNCGVRNIDIEYYIAARMMHDPKKNFEELENEYCSAYGAAASDIREYHRLWRQIGENSMKKVQDVLKKQNRLLNDAGQIGMEQNRDIAHYISEDDFKKSMTFLQNGAKKQLTPESKKFMDELLIIEEHSFLTWKFINAVNLNQKEKEQISRDLVAFREKHRDLIGWNWPSLFGHARGEKRIWEKIDWYNQEILAKSLPEKTDARQLFNSTFENKKITGWQKRPAFKDVLERPSGNGYCVAFTTTAGKYEIGISRQAGQITPGRYKLSAEICLPAPAQYMRFRIVGGGQNLLNLVEKRKDDQWRQTEKEFAVPSGVNSLIIYVIAGPGADNGSIYLDNISLSRVDEGAADAI